MTKLERLILFGSVVLSFFYRLAIIFHTRLTFGLTDDAIYASLARFFLEGKLEKAFHPTWAPLYPLLTALIYPLTSSWERSAQIIPAISGSLVIIPLYFLGKKFLSKTLAFTFAISASFIHVVFSTSLLPLSDMLSTLLLLSALTCVVYGLSEKKEKYFYFSSFFFGLTYLTRSEGFMFFGLAFVYLICWLTFDLFKKLLLRHNDKKEVLTRFRILPISIFIFLLTISPYWIATEQQTGSWSLSQKAAAQIKQGHSFQLRNATTWSQEVVSITSPNYTSEYFKDGLAHVLEYSDWYGFWFIQKLGIWKNVFLKNFPLWSLLIIVIGLVSNVFKKVQTWITLFVSYLFFTAVPITIFATPLSDPRYLLWTFPLLTLFFYLGVQTIFKLVFKNRYPHALAVITVALLLFSPIFDPLTVKPLKYATDYSNTLNHEEIGAAGNWLKENSKNPIIMMRHEGVEFYAQGKTIYIPQDIALDEVINYGKKNGAQYLIAWDWEIFADKNLNVLLNKDFNHKSIALKFKYPEENSKILIYELK